MMREDAQRIMEVSIRKFEKRDIPKKVNWINNPENNKYLHYDLPLELTKTEVWFENNKNRTDRYDAIIEANGIPVGLIGLLSIDSQNKKAEYYVTLGEREYLKKGIAYKASILLLKYAFIKLGLNRVYLYTELDNHSAIKLYEKIGFEREGLIKQDLFSKGRYVDRYLYGITKDKYLKNVATPIYELGIINDNSLFIKRDDLLPFSFGGNKVRKAQIFFEEFDKYEYDSVVTYGSSSSNHCRIVANMAAARNVACYLISPEENYKETNNSKMMDLFGAHIIKCSIDEVKNTIDKTLDFLQKEGYNPYFIPGGGHGNNGTYAYVKCYEEIREYEREHNIYFDYIFHASGTGTTQAGLVCGQLINRDDRKIVGISIARKNPRGRDIVIDSINDYLQKYNLVIDVKDIESHVHFLDDYICGGYGNGTKEISKIIKESIYGYGIPFDNTYTGKAYWGMMQYIEKQKLINKRILFLHTGGSPLFFDQL